METLLQDLRYAFRTLRKSTGFTTVATLTLALGIGANTILFSFVNSVLLRPLPFRDPSQLVWIWDSNPSAGYPRDWIRALTFLDWKRECRSLEDLAAYHAFFTWLSYNLTGRGEPERLPGIEVSQNLFPLLGVEATLGRIFQPGEDLRGASRVVVISYGLWQRRFGSDPGIIGQSVTLNGKPHTVVGVMSPHFDFSDTFVPGSKVDLFLPLVVDKEAEELGSYLAVLGRLRRGVTLAQAQAEMDTISKHLQEGHPERVGWRPLLFPLRNHVVGSVRSPLLVLLGAVGFVLLIACANIANLLLARATMRQTEMAIRAALGAGPFRLLRQLLTESIVLAMIGGALGLALGLWVLPLACRLPNLNLPRLNQVAIDYWTLAFTLLISFLTGLVFGAAPALQVRFTELNENLKEGGRAFTTGRHRMRAVLVVAEVALALILLIGAGLLTRSVHALLQVDPGFRPEHVIALRIDAGVEPGGERSQGKRLTAFFQEVLGRVTALPGVQSASLTDALPLDRDRGWSFHPADRTYPAGQEPTAWVRIISPDYFGTMAIALRQGRTFNGRDIANSTKVIIVNQTMARGVWPNQNPLGQLVHVNGQTREVVGVVADVRHSGLDAEAGREMYLPHTQFPESFMDLVVRTAVEPAMLASAIRHEVWAEDKNQPVGAVRTMDELVDIAVSPRRFSMLMLGAFATLALVLAAVGIYGVISYSVSQQTHEIGIRMALGAAGGDVLRMVTGRGAALGGLGILIGLCGAFALTRVLASELYGVSSTDPATFVGIALALMGVVLVASYLPARRATRIDPAVALRHQ